MLIEICGVDGAGKSSVSDALRRRLNERGMHAYERVVRSECRIILEHVAASHHASYSRRDIDLVVILDYLREIQTRLLIFCGNAHQHALVHHYATELWARLIEHDAADDPSLARLVQLVPAPDVSVRLNVPAVEAHRRLAGRPHGDATLAAGDPRAVLVRRVDAYRDAAKHLHYPQAAVDATEDLDAVLAAVWKVIADRCSGMCG